MSDAGINSPHNACMFRADCRKAEAEIARLRERLEVTHAYDLSGKRIEVPAGSIPDGIACRDETIKMQDAEIARLREDAARYRWMRERHENTIMDIYNSISPVMISPELLDAAIDAARKDTK